MSKQRSGAKSPYARYKKQPYRYSQQYYAWREALGTPREAEADDAFQRHAGVGKYMASFLGPIRRPYEGTRHRAPGR